MKVELIDIPAITSYVGIRVTADFPELGQGIGKAFAELIERREEISNHVDSGVTFGISPPNYKWSTGPVDFYVCYEVSSLHRLPSGMVHLRILPRKFSRTYYKGPISKGEAAYTYTTQWLEENGYAYDDTEYYFERYDSHSVRAGDDENGEIQIHCPVKRIT